MASMSIQRVRYSFSAKTFIALVVIGIFVTVYLLSQAV